MAENGHHVLNNGIRIGKVAIEYQTRIKKSLHLQVAVRLWPCPPIGFITSRIGPEPSRIRG